MTTNEITATPAQLDYVFSITGFNYDIEIKENSDGTETATFDSPADFAKFKGLMG